MRETVTTFQNTHLNLALDFRVIKVDLNSKSY